ncbi:unnamed protein product [Didymodactylos carnosus]|uniref:Uncharacterized protein n=1 Tax=Didymodactylos carnosus TaxID=1234261 RepID=A0A815WSM7_9BILA|nr:unnamed protein product [Didymodactylos carnosus]CAF1544589.1 unnamed protein product [Didymodactylos carnosus]CAF4209796.1 unnamed protein product [Didymodactylos carnosus]CAF4405202.1 unnamed protein product [Didymodactylos carnosus]
MQAFNNNAVEISTNSLLCIYHGHTVSQQDGNAVAQYAIVPDDGSVFEIKANHSVWPVDQVQIRLVYTFHVNKQYCHPFVFTVQDIESSITYSKTDDGWVNIPLEYMGR